MPALDQIEKVTKLAKTFLDSLRQTARIAANSTLGDYNESMLKTSVDTTRFVLSASNSPDLAEMLTKSPALAAMSLASEALFELSKKSPEVVEIAIMSPNLARMAEESPEIIEFAKASPLLAGKIENLLSKRK